MIIACPMFLQNIDMTAMTIALPSMAEALHVPTLHLNLIITAYLLSLAVFLPMSAWLADRFGPKRMFCVSVTLFSLASALSGTAASAGELVLYRIFQGFGAAMMIPVGRMILLRSVPSSEMIRAMVWYTVPPAIGRLSGPLIGGAIISMTSWHWIFFVNIPFGIIAVILAMLFVEDIRNDTPPPAFDVAGFVLIAIGLMTLLGGIETAGKGLVPGWVSASAAVVGLMLLGLYGLHSLRRSEPLIDLRILRFRTYRSNVIGAAPLRIAATAMPFLLPLLLQLGFGLSPLATGLLAAASALGTLCTRGVMPIALKRFGFRRLLLAATTATSLSFAACALFTATTPHALLFWTVFAGGLFSSLCMVSLNTLGFVELPKERISHATALLSMAQQLTAGTGVVLAAALLALFAWWRGGDSTHLLQQDFSATIVVIGALALLSLLSFRKLTKQEMES